MPAVLIDPLTIKPNRESVWNQKRFSSLFEFCVMVKKVLAPSEDKFFLYGMSLFEANLITHLFKEFFPWAG